MHIRPIRTHDDYKAALQEVSAYFDDEPEPNSEEGDRFEVLLTLIEAYEAKHHPMDLPDPIEAIKFRMEQEGLSAKDLEPAIGRRNRVYEILNGKRQLTLSMVWKLNRMFGIPAESLIKPPKPLDPA
ncbi:helix-turn-helix domain-containing protein [Billgrantia gudaonensis]|uniref:HTH-type transcriptional regulator / antitoxin HigA n=1 Tax=Billgrantia gudaonensis TaxID=376427 RepID=A0A1G9BNS9_9GAMM|nr:helix-turn-helix domain-containing protein [Halomonas gudaonensis]SDK40525.1 HTH-type transcriptional regulator / antitoxin HigA [Halomonas gudaonensis]